MIYEYGDYRTYLKAVWSKRRTANPSYSLRAFARDLGLDAGQLSRVFKGQKGFSQAKAYAVAERLGLDGEAQQYFLSLVQLAHARSDELASAIASRVQRSKPGAPVHQLPLDSFLAISEWYHYAIIELTHTLREPLTARVCAERLGIDALEAEIAIERLLRLGFIEQHGDGRITKTHGRQVFRTTDVVPAIRKFHRVLLEKASQSMEAQPTHSRHVGSETFAIDPTLIPEAKALIEDFYSKMLTLANQSKNPSEVYTVGVQLFALTKLNSKGQ